MLQGVFFFRYIQDTTSLLLTGKFTLKSVCFQVNPLLQLLCNSPCVCTHTCMYKYSSVSFFAHYGFKKEIHSPRVLGQRAPGGPACFSKELHQMSSQPQPSCAAGTLYPFPNMPHGWCFRKAAFLLAQSLSPFSLPAAEQGSVHTFEKPIHGKKRELPFLKRGAF